MPNQEVARRTVELIKNHEDQFNMSWWVSELLVGDVLKLDEGHPTCGTTMCAAGWAVLAAGYTIEKRDDNELYVSDSATGETFEPFRGNTLSSTDWVTAGASVLGISRDEANVLFFLGEDTALEVLEMIANGGQYTSLLGWPFDGSDEDETSADY